MKPFTLFAILCLLFCYVSQTPTLAATAGAGKEAAAAAATDTVATPDEVVGAENAEAVAAKESIASNDEIKIYKRLIPADVLRDFPGMCFASTRCATVEPGKTWELTPFCGRSTCVQDKDSQNRLLELVEDCGPLPLANEKCHLDTDKTNKTAPFPFCCPKFVCEDGVELEYPEVSKAGGPGAKL